jgi:alpha/beta superfamily hydrolase
MQEKIIIKNKQGEKLAGIFHKVNDKKQVVIVCHGWPASKENVLIKNISEKLNQDNINTFLFDFSGQGESEGKFENTTVSKEIEDIQSMVEYFHDKKYNIGLIGHSLGALVITLYAILNDKIKFIIPISSMCRTDVLKDFKTEQQESIKKGEHIYYNEKSYGQKFIVLPMFFDDLKTYNPLEEIKNIKCPKLFIHGSEDKTLKVNESNELYQNAIEPKELKIIDGADHCFTDENLLKEMIDYCINWIKKLNIFD